MALQYCIRTLSVVHNKCGRVTVWVDVDGVYSALILGKVCHVLLYA